MQPGDRRKTKCRRCGAQILIILSRRLKSIPCELLPSRADGHKTLVFANGEVNTRYADHEIGHEMHADHCRKPSGKPNARGQSAASTRGAAKSEAAFGCGCLGYE